MIRDFWISINEKYQRNKAGIWFIIIVTIFVILVLKNINKMMTTPRGSEQAPTSGSVSINTNTVDSENTIDFASIEDDYNTIDSKIIEQGYKINAVELFVNLCNNKKVNAAYDMLSDDCKNILYPTKQSFIDNYYSVIFKTSKACEITSFKNNTYKVRYSDDLITTGGNTPNDAGIIDYITTAENRKVNISGLVNKKSMDITSIAPYFTVYVEERQNYIDHVVLKVKVKNNTYADIYINDENENGLYLKGTNNGMYPADVSEMFESDYLVSNNSEKEIKLNFNIGMSNDEEMNEFYLGKMKIVNKEYYDSTSNYEKKKTNYPELYNWTVNLK